MIAAGSKKLLIMALLMGVAVTGALQLQLRGSVGAHSDRIIRMVDRSAELYRQITMSSEPVSLAMSQCVNYDADRTPVPELVVQITPEQDGAAVVLTWDSVTAHVVSVRHSDIRLTGNEGHALAPREAAEIARTWLRTLLPSGEPSEWKLLAHPTPCTDFGNHSIYEVRWGSQDREVEVIIEDHTGDLLSMQECPLSRYLRGVDHRDHPLGCVGTQ